MSSYWVDGKLSKKKDCLCGMDLGALHYGLAVFEGILAVKIIEKRKERVVLFMVSEHIERFTNSANIMGIDLRYSHGQIIEAIRKTIIVNGLNNYYIRPILFSRGNYIRLMHKRGLTTFAILHRSFNFRLFTFKMKMPVSLVCFEDLINPFRGDFAPLKASGRYLINTLAKRYAYLSGCDDAVLFSPSGNVTEATSANLFILKDDKVITPPLDNIIEGITRRTAINILFKMGISVVERDIRKKELLDSDAIFMTGSATGIVLAKKICSKKLNSNHKLLLELQNRYLDIISARDREFNDYITYI